jgi:GntR family transcriptional regulator/MocR family aminotransferase
MLRKHEETVYSRASAGNVIYINTFTRTISPALRLGYMVLPPELLPVFDRTVGFYSCTVPAFEQMVLERLLNEGDFERHINRIRREKRRK